MPDFPTSQVELIDQRIDQSLVKPTKMGTVQDRETDTARAIVTFDGGAGVGQPVKCFENVVVDIGDRVGLAKLEGEWIIIGSYTPRLWGDVLVGVVLASGNTTTSATFVDVPSSPSASVVKYRDVTQLQLFIGITMTTTVSPTVVEIAANVALPDGTNFDQVMYHRALNAPNDHRDLSGGLTTVGLTLPGGGYAITARWRRLSGSGTLTMDSNDSCTVWAREVLV